MATVKTTTLSPIDVARFWSSVDVRGLHECWDWRGGSFGPGGHGRFALKNGRIATHRAAFELVRGAVPEGKWVLHHCDNPKCCNPKHLYAGSHADNTQDAVDRRRMASGERNGNTKLSEDQARFIRKNPLRLTGEQLAKRFNVASSTISYIRNGRSWKYLEDGAR